MTEQHVHSAGDTDESVKAGPAFATTEPVLVLAGVAVLSELSAAVALALRRPRAASVALGIGALATAFMGARTHDLVTPMARPQDDEGEPLTPLAAAEPEGLEAVEEDMAAPTAAITAVGTEDSAPPSTP
jgi:hypothetical protein